MFVKSDAVMSSDVSETAAIADAIELQFEFVNEQLPAPPVVL